MNPPSNPRAHRIIARGRSWKALANLRTVTLLDPVWLGRLSLFAGRQSWEARTRTTVAHEFVHLEQIDKLGRCGYLAAHVVARARSVFMWLRVRIDTMPAAGRGSLVRS